MSLLEFSPTKQQIKYKPHTTWANQAGPRFKYFLVFDKNTMAGAYTLEKFMELMEAL